MASVSSQGTGALPSEGLMVRALGTGRPFSPLPLRWCNALSNQVRLPAEAAWEAPGGTRVLPSAHRSRLMALHLGPNPVTDTEPHHVPPGKAPPLPLSHVTGC